MAASSTTTAALATAPSSLQGTSSLENLKFDNKALRVLPIDPIVENYTRQVPNACFSLVEPVPLDSPVLVAASKSALALVDIEEGEILRDDFAEYFGGNKVLPGARPAAHCYCGHQFGYFSGQLGDGATMYLGEVINAAGQRMELQFKGAGPTPYSRQADGRKVLRSSLREFLMSEAMHALGIPTTRAGTLVTSSTLITRDVYYTGNPIEEKASVITRLAPTFIRFGSFEIVKETDSMTGRAGPSPGNTELASKLFEYVRESFYPEIQKESAQATNVAVFKEIVERTAHMVALWQSVGWCHGVLNTDNMSILGLTIDYGPFGMLEHTDIDHICNGSDKEGRYSYRRQPEMCQWNCTKLAEALSSVIPLEETMPICKTFDAMWYEAYLSQMRRKLGLRHEAPSDSQLVDRLVETLHDTGADWTNTFRFLAEFRPSDPNSLMNTKAVILSQCIKVGALRDRYTPSIPPQQLQMLVMYAQTQPHLLARLGVDVEVLVGELRKMERLAEVKDLKEEDKAKTDDELWRVWLEMYAKRLETEEGTDDERMSAMNAVNPLYILRNHVLQKAIKDAEGGDFSETRRLLDLVERPFEERPCSEAPLAWYTRPEVKGRVIVTCSS